jgi:hypothetical protein
MMCMPGDTPGPAGFGRDGAAALHDPAVGTVHMLLIDEKHVMGWLRRAAYVRAALQSARQDMKRHIEGDTKVVDERRDRLLEVFYGNWVTAKQTGADATLEFCEHIREQADTEFAELMKLYGVRMEAARTRTRWIGYGGMVIADIKLAATLVRKVVSLVPNPVGWGIDVTTDVAEEGIKAYTSSGSDPGTRASLAEIQKLATELMKKGVEEAPEIAELVLKAHGAEITEAEVEVLERRVATLTAKLGRRMERYAAHRAVVKNVEALLARTSSVLMRRKAVLLPMRGAKWLAKKGFGHVVGGLFVAWDVTEAFEEWHETIEGFSE